MHSQQQQALVVDSQRGGTHDGCTNPPSLEKATSRSRAGARHADARPASNLHLLEVEQLGLAGFIGDVLDLVCQAAQHGAAAGFVHMLLLHAHLSAHLLQHFVTRLSQPEVQPASCNWSSRQNTIQQTYILYHVTVCYVHIKNGEIVLYYSI